MSEMQSVGGADIEKAIALFKAGNAAGAAQACRAALRRDGRNVTARFLLALTQMQERNFEEAERQFAKATELAPAAAEIWANRGNNQIARGRADRALEFLTRALALEPNFPEALYNRAKLLTDAGRLGEALAAYDKCIALVPRFADAMNSRGVILAKLDRHDEALASYDRALRSAPNVPDLLDRRGNLLATLGRDDEAFASFDKCLSADPQYAPGWLSVAKLLVSRKRFEEALGVIRKLLAVAPDADFARGYLAYVKLNLCDWDGLPEDIAVLRDQIVQAKAVTLPFHSLLTLTSPNEQLLCAKARVALEFPRGSITWSASPRYDHERIRLAYVSADFHEHATSHLMAGLIEHHDRNRFETIAISFGPDDDSETQRRIRGAFDRFVDVRGCSDLEAGRRIRELEVDIAVDLKGFTGDCRPGILVSRPAPLQVSYLGYPGTMGADFIDYIIADRWVIPPDQRRYYAEEIVYLPDCYRCNDDKRTIGTAAPTRIEAGLPAQGFVFCSFNHTFKIMPEVFDVWMRLLGRIEGSVLWQLADHPAARRNLRAEAERRGIAPDRIVFADRLPPDRHLARHALADLFLDTLPYGAHTTASDALWAGLPLLTCLGSAFAGRVAASLLHAIGLPELVTTSLDEYETLAVELASEPVLLGALKAKLAVHRRTHALFDTARFCRGIEAAYVTMRQRHQRGDPPEGFAIAARDRDGP
jgi:protein O-GlcNAc transferase